MQRRIPNRNGLKRSDPETIMTPTLQVPHSLSPYHKGDKRLCNCKWAIFNNIHNLHVLYSIAFLMRRFYALALGKPLEAGGGGSLEQDGHRASMADLTPCAFQGRLEAASSGLRAW